MGSHGIFSNRQASVARRDEPRRGEQKSIVLVPGTSTNAAGPPRVSSWLPLKSVCDGYCSEDNIHDISSAAHGAAGAY